MKNIMAYMLIFVCASVSYGDEFKTWLDFRDQEVAKQQYGFSCGAASLATYFTKYLDRNTGEKEILDIVFGCMSKSKQDQKKERGLSLLDLKSVGQNFGFQPYPFKSKLDFIWECEFPFLMQLDCEGEKHFVIFEGIIENRVMLADPSRGNISMSLREVDECWKSRVGLAIMNKKGKLPRASPMNIRQPVLDRSARMFMYRK